jgi:translation initiation factor 2A
LPNLYLRYYLSVKDGMSIHVQLDKDGPIYNFDWSPCGKVFAVVYGFMPAKVMLFDSNCDKVGTSPLVSPVAHPRPPYL